MYNKINVQRHLEERECPNCGKIWSIYARGYAPKSRYRFCETCNPLFSNWEKKSIKYHKYPEEHEKFKRQKRQEFERRYIQQMLLKSKRRALLKNLDFNLEMSDIIIPKMCPILEVNLVIGTKGNYEFSPSLDRIDNTKGYIKGNVQVISKKANSMKNSASIEELKKFCANVLRYSLNITENKCDELQDKEPVS